MARLHRLKPAIDSGESLAGESLADWVEYIDMAPLNVLEVGAEDTDSYSAQDDVDSYVYRDNFIRTYLERDVPQFSPRIPAETLQPLWTILAHSQGQCLNASKLAILYMAPVGKVLCWKT